MKTARRGGSVGRQNAFTGSAPGRGAVVETINARENTGSRVSNYKSPDLPKEKGLESLVESTRSENTKKKKHSKDCRIAGDRFPL